jgi:hypothetical protein
MDKSDDLIFDLFIMQFWKGEVERWQGLMPREYEIDSYMYELNKLTPSFFTLKACFPFDEVSEQEIFHCGNKCYCKTITWIR